MHHHHYLAAPVAGLVLFAVLPWPIALPTYVIATLVALAFWRKILEAQRLPVVTGSEALPGRSGYISARGQARIGGENWLVESDVPLAAGARVRVLAVQGLRLKVEPVPTHSEPALTCSACSRSVSERWTHCPHCGEYLL